MLWKSQLLSVGSSQPASQSRDGGGSGGIGIRVGAVCGGVLHLSRWLIHLYRVGGVKCNRNQISRNLGETKYSQYKMHGKGWPTNHQL